MEYARPLLLGGIPNYYSITFNSAITWSNYRGIEKCNKSLCVCTRAIMYVEYSTPPAGALVYSSSYVFLRSHP